MIDYYEILEVHPKASQEIIKKAYQTLAKKYHPDIFPNKDEATRIMSILNEAYSILSNEKKRMEYDKKIYESYFPSQTIKQDHNQKSTTTGENQPQPPNQNISLELQQFIDARKLAYINGEIFFDAKRKLSLSRINGIGTTFFCRDNYDNQSNSYVTQYWLTILFLPIFPFGRYRVIERGYGKYLIISKVPFNGMFIKEIISMYKRNVGSWVSIAIALYILMTSIFPFKEIATASTKSTSPSPTAVSGTTAPLKNIPQKDILTQYIPNEPMLHTDGLTVITIDNSKNKAPVFVRIWSLEKQEQPVRSITIAPYEKFSAKNLTPGKYEVRYKFLYENNEAPSGSKSEPINLVEKETQTGTQYSNVTLTLYTVQNGNMKITSIPLDKI